MNEIDRKIAERLNRPLSDVFMYRWSENIAAALVLVEKLGIRLTIEYFPKPPTVSAGEHYRALAPVAHGSNQLVTANADKLAEAVAAAILAWLEAQEAGR